MLTRDQIRSGLDELKQIAEEIRLKVHLASMDARTYWADLEPKLERLERTVEEKSNEALGTAGTLFEDVGKAVRKLRDQLREPTSKM